MGLGEAIARMFAREGATILCIDIRAEQNERVVKSILETGGRAFSIIADLANASEVQRVGNEIDEYVGRVNVLVNNAGIIPSRETVLNIFLFDRIMRLKDKVVLITGASKGIGRALALGMAREGADVVINYCSDKDGAQEAV